MEKLLECIYAYLYRNNYAGSCYGEGVYTLTEGLAPHEQSAVSAVMRKAGMSGLNRVDRENGVSPDLREPLPDYGTAAYSYYPCLEGYKVFCRNGLRASLQGRRVRGSHEIMHAVLGQGELPAGAYAVDYCLSPRLETPADIPLRETNDGADYVTEETPALLSPLDGSAFSSAPVTSAEIFALGAGALRLLARIISALDSGKQNAKPVFLAIDPSERAKGRDYIRMALKLLPARLANTVSFCTCYGGDAHACEADLCVIPTRDTNYIRTLAEIGYVVTPADTGDFHENKSYAAFLFGAELGELDTWLGEMTCYTERVESFDELNSAFALYRLAKHDDALPEAEGIFRALLQTEADEPSLYELVSQKVFAACSEEERLSALCTAYASALSGLGRVDRALLYLCSHYNAAAHDKALLLCLLAQSVPAPQPPTLREIFALFLKITVLAGAASEEGVRKLLYGDFAKRILDKCYREALSSVEIKDVTEEDVAHCRELIAVYSDSAYRSAVDQNFIPALEALFARYAAYLEQSAAESNLQTFRKDFVVRELLLLDKKTIYRIFTGCVDPKAKRSARKSLIDGQWLREKFKGTKNAKKPYRDSKFLELAQNAAAEFLLDPSVPPEHKTLFCARVRAERERRNNLNGADVKDFVQGVIVSSVFAAVFTAIVSAAGFMLWQQLLNGYFLTAFLLIDVIAFAVAEVTYWNNWRGVNRRLRKPVLEALWQSTVIMVVMIALYLGVQIAFIKFL